MYSVSRRNEILHVYEENRLRIFISLTMTPGLHSDIVLHVLPKIL